jgi:hypothetical protein
MNRLRRVLVVVSGVIVVASLACGPTSDGRASPPDPGIKLSEAPSDHPAQSTPQVTTVTSAASDPWVTLFTDAKTAYGGAKSAISVFSTINSGISVAETLLRDLGLMSPAVDEVAALQQDLENIGLSLSQQIQADFNTQEIGNIEGTMNTLSTYDALGMQYTYTSPGYEDSVNAVEFLGAQIASEHIYLDSATNGDGNYWKNFISQRAAPTPDGNAYSWQTGVPTYLHSIAARLAVISHVDTNFQTDQAFQSEFSQMFGNLSWHYSELMSGLTCLPYTRGPGRGQLETCIVICADMNSGIYAQYVFPATGDGNECYVVPPATRAAVAAEVADVTWQITSQMPIFAVKSTMDLISLYMNPNPDLTQTYQQLEPEASTGLCLAVPGGSATPGLGLVLEPCDGSNSQWWTYNRATGQIENPTTGTCVDTTGVSPVPGTVAQSYPCTAPTQVGPTPPSGAPPVMQVTNAAQVWTYDPVGKLVMNAMGTVLAVNGPLAAGSPLVANAPVAGSPLQMWHADLPSDPGFDEGVYGCADGTVEQTFPNGAVGCSGAVSWPARNSLCANGGRVCTAAEWAALGGSVAPTHNYWTDDNLLWSGGGSGSCTASDTTGNACTTNEPMRVCTSSGSDPEGNACNWTGCGLDSTTNEFFGGCDGNATAGALCCGGLSYSP